MLFVIFFIIFYAAANSGADNFLSLRSVEQHFLLLFAEQHPVEPPAKDPKPQPSHAGVHLELPRALPSTRRGSKDLVPTAVAVERKNPPGVSHVHGISSPHRPAPATPGRSANPVAFFSSPPAQHASLRRHPSPHQAISNQSPHPGKGETKQGAPGPVAWQAPASNPPAHVLNQTRASPDSFKHPTVISSVPTCPSPSAAAAAAQSAAALPQHKTHHQHPFATNKPRPLAPPSRAAFRPPGGQGKCTEMLFSLVRVLFLPWSAVGSERSCCCKC